MSRLGKIKINVPSTTKILIKSRLCIIEGPFGRLLQLIPKSIFLQIGATGISFFSRGTLTNTVSQQLGLVSRLVKNKILGVNHEFEKKLQLFGVGYRAKIENNFIFLIVGYSHKTFFSIPLNIRVTIRNNITISLKGIDKNLVSLFASKLRRLKPPEPYKGKGIRYLNESVQKKIGKSTKT